ncbi:hypothetical protein LQW54_007357 [Pestalotiopsis sp. IQ-011]
MATIEPRLIHLLNESTATPKPHHAELPPIKGLSLPKPTNSQHPHPIEPGAGQRADGHDAAGTAGQLGSQSMPSFLALTEEGASSTSSRTTGERHLPHHISSQELRKILDDTSDVAEDATTKKRPSKEDFMHLPQPPKKQKASAEMRFPQMPPMIVGLIQPPPDAALFPSMPSYDDSRPRSEPPKALSIGKPPELPPATEEQTAQSPPPDAERTPTGRLKRRAAKPRRKWTEEETNHLLLGVSKHGVGRWTDILDDKDFNFNDRTAGDLKDRFRTCCPDELRSSVRGKQVAKQAKSSVPANVKPTKGLMSENILNEPEDVAESSDKAPSVQNESDSGSKQRKSRAHRKKLEDLAELGIKGPFKKSQRRGRRPFSEQDDQEILQGFEIYGPQWTRIQRDSRFHLSTRQPTDLRDRLRNKYPEKFVTAEKTQLQVKSNGLLEPSVDMNIGHTFDKSKSALLEPQLYRSNEREDMPKWPLSTSLMDTSDASQASHSAIWGEAAGGTLAGMNEMDISRLLLDDRHAAHEPPAPEKRGYG